jgi:hypothetical protein
MTDHGVLDGSRRLPLSVLATLAGLCLVGGLFRFANFFTDLSPDYFSADWPTTVRYSVVSIAYSAAFGLLFLVLLRSPRWFVPAYWLFLSVGVVDAVKLIYPATFYFDSAAIGLYVCVVLALLLSPSIWFGVVFARKWAPPASGWGILLGLGLALGTWLPIRLTRDASFVREVGAGVQIVGLTGSELFSGASVAACYCVAAALLFSFPRNHVLARPWAFIPAGLLCLLAAWPVGKGLSLVFAEPDFLRWEFSSGAALLTGALSVLGLLGACEGWRTLAGHRPHGAV